MLYRINFIRSTKSLIIGHVYPNSLYHNSTSNGWQRVIWHPYFHTHEKMFNLYSRRRNFVLIKFNFSSFRTCIIGSRQIDVTFHIRVLLSPHKVHTLIVLIKFRFNISHWLRDYFFGINVELDGDSNITEREIITLKILLHVKLISLFSLNIHQINERSNSAQLGRNIYLNTLPRTPSREDILIALVELNTVIDVEPLNEWQILELGHFEVGNFDQNFFLTTGGC